MVCRVSGDGKQANDGRLTPPRTYGSFVSDRKGRKKAASWFSGGHQSSANLPVKKRGQVWGRGQRSGGGGGWQRGIGGGRDGLSLWLIECWNFFFLSLCCPINTPLPQTANLY